MLYMVYWLVSFVIKMFMIVLNLFNFWCWIFFLVYDWRVGYKLNINSVCINIVCDGLYLGFLK